MPDTNIKVHLPISSQLAIFWMAALSVPYADLGRLTLRPLKWLRFATFTICGVQGHLSESASPKAQIVDYENAPFPNHDSKYYYHPVEFDAYHFVDPHAFDVRYVSRTHLPSRRAGFRDDVIRRDGGCIITRANPKRCQAAHIIPRCKGPEYITFVVRDRSGSYEQLPFASEDSESHENSENSEPDEDSKGVDIDCIENTMLLRNDVHGSFGRAEIVFLKTPNFAMGPDDVPVEGSISGTVRMTLQHILPADPEEFNAVKARDVIKPDWSGEKGQPPSSIFLDFIYGAVIAERWASDELKDLLDYYFEECFDPILTDPVIEENAADPEDRNVTGAPEENVAEPADQSATAAPEENAAQLEDQNDPDSGCCHCC